MLLFILGNFTAVPAYASDGGISCHIPQTLPTPRPAKAAAVDVRRMPVGGYTLALSWSPQHCAEQRGGGSSQCNGRYGRFGFILHGLWPEGRNGQGWPQYCGAASSLSQSVLKANFCAMPSVQLMQHQWAKHGTCMARQPEEYFTKARQLYQAIKLPQMDALARKSGLKAGDLTSALMNANKGLLPDSVRIRSNRAGYLDEIWICLDMNFKPTRCGNNKRGMRAVAPLKIRRIG